MNEELAGKLKYLRLGGLLSHWDEHLKLGAAKRFSHAQLLTHVVQEEYLIKKNNARQKRLKQARIPEVFVIQTYPFERQPKLNKKMIMAMYDSFEYMEKNRGIIWLGPTGVGKSGLATSFLVHAIEEGFTGRYIPFAELVAELYRSVGDHSEEKVLQRYLSYDCLLIDEIGYVEVEPVQVGLFFTLMQMRHKKKPTIITSNLGFGDWKTFLKNDHLTAALIDRLTETCYVVNMRNCVGLRPKLSPEA
jgi:DNA replication protein DnaC